VFDAPSTTSRERKQLLRAIVSEVVISVDATKRTSALRNHLAGAGCTALEMTLTKTGGHFRATDEDTAAAAPARRTAGRPGDAILPRVPASCLPQVTRYDAAGSSAQRANGTRHRDLQNAGRLPLSYAPPSAQT
jgi:hypothetical protein